MNTHDELSYQQSISEMTQTIQELLITNMSLLDKTKINNQVLKNALSEIEKLKQENATLLQQNQILQSGTSSIFDTQPCLPVSFDC